MTPDDRALIVEIGQAARICAMYRELLEVARRYQHADEVERLTRSLAGADSRLARLIAKALEDNNEASRRESPEQEPPTSTQPDEPGPDPEQGA